MEYIMSHLYSTNKVEQWYIRHNKFIVLYQELGGERANVKTVVLGNRI